MRHIGSPTALPAASRPGGQVLVVGVERRQVGPERDARRAGQRGDGDRDSPGASSSARLMASASTSRPSASVLPISTVMPFRLVQHVARPEGIAGDAVLGGGDQHAQPHRQLGAHDEEREGKRRGGAAHVLLHQRHGARRLDVEPAGIEADALADDGHLGRVLRAPAEIDQAWRPVAGAAHGVDHREIVGKKPGAFGDLDAARRTRWQARALRASSSAGPRSLAGVLMRSRPK